MSIESQLVEFAVRARLEDVPERTVAFSKQLFAKIIASMIKGSCTASGKKALAFVAEHGSTDRSTTVIGRAAKASMEDAAFVNGYFAHASELEDDQFPSGTSDITVVPIVCSMIEKYGLTGKDALEATIVGLEVMNRVGTYSLASKGIVELCYYGGIGGCVSAGKALKLGSKEMLGAIGIAMGRAAGLISNFGTDAHFIESALAGRDGLLAALMAKNGMAGNPDVATWLTNLLGAGNWKPEAIVGDLGKAWRVHTIWVKKYPSCFITHRPIDILLGMLAAKRFKAEQVAEITVEDNTVSKICDRPTPAHTDDARFSFQHALAAALLDGDVEDHHFAPAVIADPRFVSTREKVRVVLHQEWPRKFLSGPCRVTVKLSDGKEVTGESETAGGAPDRPLSADEVHRLFDKILKPVAAQSDIDWLWETIDKLERQTDLQPFLEKLRRVTGAHAT